ncbi:MAG: hypothetical protein Q9160_002072 [Pyrenula sp. 1 TL-2023]
MSGRDCSFAFQVLPKEVSPPASSTASHDQSTSSSNKHSPSPSSQADGTPLNVSLTNTNRPQYPCTNPYQDSSLDESVNPYHTELLLHLLTDSSMFNLGARIDNYSGSIPYALNLGLKCPYFLHQLLAFSARHLAYLDPTSTTYLHQACALQTRAISLFNASFTFPSEKPNFDESNCIPALLFSVVLGHHLLADTLSLLTSPSPDADKDSDKLSTFLTHYTQRASLHHGIHTITLATWPSLIHSPLLGPILSQSAAYTSQTAHGTRTHRLQQLINASNTLDESEKKACLTATRYLQLGFDALDTAVSSASDTTTTEAAQPSNPSEMLFLFHVLIPPEFTQLLVARRREALAVMGYYALLLHEGGRGMWQVGEAGKELGGLLRGGIGQLGGE